MQPILFFDGECGLCHRAVRLLLRLDRRARLRFAPLGGPTFCERVAQPERSELPDSLVMLTEGRLLVRGAAVREGLRLVGGSGRLLAAALGLLPAPLADRLYDALARVRFRLFARPAGSCPVPPGRWRDRFLP